MAGRRSLMALLLCLAACAAPTPDRIVLARLDGRPLTLEEALGTFTGTHGGHGALVRGEPAVRELIGRIVERELLLGEAEALGLPDDPLVREAVHARCLTRAMARFCEDRIDGAAAVSDADVEAFYDRTDQAVRVSLVLVPDRALADDLRARVVAGEDLATLAQEHSEHESSAFGGSLGFVTRGQLDDELDGPAFALEQPGDLTPVFETDEGFVFLRLDERVMNANRPSREVALPQIRGVLERRAEERQRAALEQEMMARFDGHVDETLVTRDRLLGEGDEDAVVARCGERTFRLGEFRELFELDAVRAATDDDVADAAREVARGWVLELALEREIERIGLLHDAEIEALAERAEDEIVLGLLVRDYINASVQPDEAAVRAYYEEHLESEFTRPAEVHMAYVALATEADALAILGRLEAGELFADLAREASLDRTSAGHGGRIGWIRPGQILPEVEERAFAMEPESIEGPIETSEGWFVIQVLERTEPFLLPYDQSRRTALRRLVEELRAQAHRDWILKLRERARIEIDEQGLAQAVAWLDAEAEATTATLVATTPDASEVPVLEPSAADAGGPSPPPELLGPLPPGSPPDPAVDAEGA